MEYKYIIDDQKKIIFITYNGKMSIDALNDNRLKLLEDKNFNADYDILTDARKCEFDFDPEDLQKHTNLIKKTIGTICVKSAIVVDTPHETASAVFFQEMARGLRRVEIFSTIEAAVIWLRG